MSTITTNIDNVVAALNSNQVVAIPTETVYGLAGNATSEAAIRQIYALKNRPLTHPLILHVSKDADLMQWVEVIPSYAKDLMAAFWPGPLTLVFHAKKNVLNPLITAGQSTVAIRCPKHEISQDLLQKLPFPLVAPSANPFGKLSPTAAEDVQKAFPDDPLLILDGGRCALGIESTIVTATDPNAYQILRQGLIDESMLEAILPGMLGEANSTIAVPGRLEQHYQPNKILYRFDFGDYKTLEQWVAKKSQAYYLLSFNNQDTNSDYQWPNNPKAFAYELYHQLRLADESQADYLITELPKDEKKWQGIRERLLKASYPIYTEDTSKC